MSDERGSCDDLRRRLDEAEAILRSLNGADGGTGGTVQTADDAAAEAVERAIRAIMQLMNEGAAMLDCRGVVLQCNPPLARLVGEAD